MSSLLSNMTQAQLVAIVHRLLDGGDEAEMSRLLDQLERATHPSVSDLIFYRDPPLTRQ